jgi:hypothetical protein
VILAILVVSFISRGLTEVPHVYFSWTEGDRLLNLLEFLLIGVGEIAPVTREVLREAEQAPGTGRWCT